MGCKPSKSKGAKDGVDEPAPIKTGEVTLTEQLSQQSADGTEEADGTYNSWSAMEQVP